MAVRSPSSFLRLSGVMLAGMLALGAARVACADRPAAATDTLKDFDAFGIIQVFRPGNPTPIMRKGIPTIDPGMGTAIFFRQAYVHPDRLLMAMDFFGSIQSRLVQGETELTYSPSVGYVEQRTYRNLDEAKENPMSISALSLAGLGKLVAQSDSAKVLPTEDLDQVKKAQTARLEALQKKRVELEKSTDPTDQPRAQVTVADLARTKNDLDQLDIRRAHPCQVLEFDNKEFLKLISVHSLVGAKASKFLDGGKSTVWMTRAEGLPVKVEVANREGVVIIQIICSRGLKINQGLQPGEVGLGLPGGIRRFGGVCDARDQHSIDKMEGALKAQIQAYQADLQQLSGANRSSFPPQRKP